MMSLFSVFCVFYLLSDPTEVEQVSVTASSALSVVSPDVPTNEFEVVRNSALYRMNDVYSQQTQFLHERLDPCARLVAQELAAGTTDFSTVYCPDVKMYWKNNERGI
jgi:hypothetical protein